MIEDKENWFAWWFWYARMISLRLATKETTTRPNLPKRQENVPIISKLVSLRVNNLQENYLDRQGNSYDMMLWTFAIFFLLQSVMKIPPALLNDMIWCLLAFEVLGWHVTKSNPFINMPSNSKFMNKWRLQHYWGLAVHCHKFANQNQQSSFPYHSCAYSAYFILSHRLCLLILSSYLARLSLSHN